MDRDWTAVTLTEVVAELEAIARDTQAVFGSLDEARLNWRPSATSWSVAQCFDHLLAADRQMLAAMNAAIDGSRPPAWWQRLPGLPAFFGAVMIKSLRPEATRKYKAPATAIPASSALDAGIIDRFVAQQHEAAGRLRTLDERDAARLIMISPFVAFITYSVLDGCRLIVTHGRRHFEQARRVTQQPGFPRA
jgi:hypothetical protein